MLEDCPYEIILLIFSFLYDSYKRKLFKSFNKNIYDKATKYPGKIELHDYYYSVNNLKNNNLVLATKIKMMDMSDMIFMFTIRDNITHIISHISEFDYYNSFATQCTKYIEFPKLEQLIFYNEPNEINCKLSNIYYYEELPQLDIITDKKYLTVSDNNEHTDEILSKLLCYKCIFLPDSIKYLVLKHYEFTTYIKKFPKSLITLDIEGRYLINSIFIYDRNFPRTLKNIKLSLGRYYKTTTSSWYNIIFGYIPDSVETIILDKYFVNFNKPISKFPKNLKTLVVHKQIEKYLENIPKNVSVIYYA